ncbi:transposase [Ideonella sp. B7]|uniref:DDE-type integrase/transposase/recombinase n=1 Tax=Ideonella benzenivorans TaxID=2831643 RepID=UPI001CED2AFA|nr:DDE-type integrase/transposase/recombinase [Ideonella benzenivorans]MCA6218568.1 transposase [Ideonella benzenivorans]
MKNGLRGNAATQDALMSKAFLRAGVKVLIRKEEHVVERQCEDGIWVLRNEKTDRALELNTDEIVNLYATGHFVFRAGPIVSLRDGRIRPAPLPERPVDAGSDPDAKYRLKFVRGVAGFPITQAVLQPRIQEIWEALDPRHDRPPGWTSVYRWVRAFERSEGNPLSLIASVSARGNRTPRFEKEVLWICEDTIESEYLTLERPSIADVTRICQARVRAVNKTRSPREALRKPTDRLLKRLIGLLPVFDVYRARHGRDAALKKFRNSTKVRIAEAILEHGEMDHTRLDLFAIDDDTGVPLGRPWLTVLIDVYSRYILGIAISFEPPSRATVAQCLRHAFMPKQGLRERFPEIVNDWDGYGIFSGITVDGGAEFRSEELERIYFECDIEAVFAPRKTPWFKGKVERVQGTLNRGISAFAPGKTFEGIVDKEDYDPTQHAIVTLSQLELIVNKWIVDVYHQKPHRALGCSPAKMWKDSAKTTNIPMIADPLRFEAIVAGSDKRILSHKGIEYSNLLYNSPEMGELRRIYGDRIEVEIRFNRSNYGSVIVLHPERKTPIRVPCLRPDYAEGLTEWQHKICRRYAREHGSGDDPDAYLDAFHAISKLVRADLKVGKAKGVSRERMARWKGGKQGDEANDLPQHQPEAQPPSLGDQLAPLVTGKASPTPAPSPAPEPRAKTRPIHRFEVRIEDRNPAVDGDREAPEKDMQ